MTSFYIETYGCSANVADSEQMAGLLVQADFNKVSELEEADIIILNSCTVKTPTADSFITRLHNLKKEYPYKVLVITGCIPQSEPERFKEFSLVGTRQIHNIVTVVEEALNDNTVKALQTGEMPPLNLPTIRRNPIVEVIPINRGCLSACTFCKTKQARGNLQSYPMEEIVTRAQKSIREGVKEIWLTSQDTFCYGFDIGTTLPDLIEQLIMIQGKFKIRIGMGNPVHLKKIKERLYPLLTHEKVFQFLHIPAQAGSDQVLTHMRRGNTNEEFISLVKDLKVAVPNIQLATDIIVGYPTETEDEFWQTLETVRKTSPDAINISKFWPRPDTPAAKLEELPIAEVKRRTSVLTDIFHNISRLQNENWIGWQGEIIIDEKGREGQWIGRNKSYKQVIVHGEYKLGDTINVKIQRAGVFDLRGVVI